ALPPEQRDPELPQRGRLGRRPPLGRGDERARRGSGEGRMNDPAGDDRSRLLSSLALSQRFHLYLVQVESPRAADQLVATLGADLAALGREGVRVVRLDPYAGRETAHPLIKEELDDRVLLPLLDTPKEVWGAIHVVDASRAPPEDVE